MPSKTALITGITGQDGAYLSRLLINKGYRVHGVVRPGHKPNLTGLDFVGAAEGVDLHQADLLDLGRIRGLLEEIRPTEIYNLASQSSVGRSFAEPIETIGFNTLSAVNLLEAIRLTGGPIRFYQASSSEMFGRAERLPVDEQTVLHPVSPYGISKAAAHWSAVNYREAHGLFCCCGILFNHESCLRAPHFVTKKIISRVIAIADGDGGKLKLGNLDVARDWGYAPEYVKAMWLMLQEDEPDDFIITASRAHTLREFVNTAFKLAGLSPEEHLEVDQALYRPSELDMIYGDPGKARRKLGWHYGLGLRELVEQLLADERRFNEWRDA